MTSPIAAAVSPLAVLAQSQAGSEPLAGLPAAFETLLFHIVSVIIFSAIGMVVFGLALWLFNRLCPFSLRKELEEDQNTAIGIIVGSLIIGMAIIIAAAVHG